MGKKRYMPNYANAVSDGGISDNAQKKRWGRYLEKFESEAGHVEVVWIALATRKMQSDHSASVVDLLEQPTTCPDAG
jgi:hypothetical protein